MDIAPQEPDIPLRPREPSGDEIRDEAGGEPQVEEAPSDAPPSLRGAGPTPDAERIESIDVLRGFVLLGILVMNIQAFSMIEAAYSDPTAYGNLEGPNLWIWVAGHLFADQKFMTIFSMLFGAGILLMGRRSDRSGRFSPVARHFRRMAVLVAFGLLHSYLIWYGDILYAYGMCGFVVYFFRRLSGKILFPLGLLSIALTAYITYLTITPTLDWPGEALQTIERDLRAFPPTPAEEIAIKRGSWSEQMELRAVNARLYHTYLFALFIAWRVGGLMLLGMAFFKAGVFSARRSTAFYLVLFLGGMGIGLPIVAYGAYRNFQVGWEAQSYVGRAYNYWASIVVALGWVGLIMLICKHRIAPRATAALAAVGRMALTNYLAQSVICTLIFYGHGLGLFCRVERTGQLAITVAIWIVQIVYSSLWLRVFRFGPIEWLWRSLTYGELQPMALRQASPAAMDGAPPL